VADDLFLIDPAGTSVRRLATKAGNPGWSSDSRQLVFEYRRGLYVINAGGSKLHRLYQPTRGKAPRLIPPGHPTAN
jgi:hypothetical protein